MKLLTVLHRSKNNSHYIPVPASDTKIDRALSVVEKLKMGLTDLKQIMKK